jgi:NADPH:quinone reductase-like Zn-dependent oxidoreductase
MHALVLDAPAPVSTRPLVRRELPEPLPGPDEVVVRVGVAWISAPAQAAVLGVPGGSA